MKDPIVFISKSTEKSVFSWYSPSNTLHNVCWEFFCLLTKDNVFLIHHSTKFSSLHFCSSMPVHKTLQTYLCVYVCYSVFINLIVWFWNVRFRSRMNQGPLHSILLHGLGGWRLLVGCWPLGAELRRKLTAAPFPLTMLLPGVNLPVWNFW